jgi:uncharacterized protein (TIGR00251 family)
MKRSPRRRGTPADPAARSPVILTVHVQPRATRTEVVGMHGEAVKIRLKAPPVDGAANEELVRFLAERLGIGRGGIVLLSGATARTKRLRVSHAGFTAGDAMARLLGPRNER